MGQESMIILTLFNTGDIKVNVTNGGVLTVGNIGNNRVLTLNNKIEVGNPTAGTITGSILGLTESKITLGTSSQLITESCVFNRTPPDASGMFNVRKLILYCLDMTFSCGVRTTKLFFNQIWAIS